MDIGINKGIEYKDLMGFFESQFPNIDFFLVYEGLNDWDDVHDEEAIFQYFENEDIEQGFRYGLCIAVKSDDFLSLVEKLSSELSSRFNCGAFCDASRVVLDTQNPYYSLLFERGKVYLVTDYEYEETGNVTKVVELTYECPEH